MMGGSRKGSKVYSSGFIEDYQNAVEAMGESEGFGSLGHVDSQDSCVPKRKCISLNLENSELFNVPSEIISLSKMSDSDMKELKMRLRTELTQLQQFQIKISSRSRIGVNSVALCSSTDVPVKKQSTIGHNGSNLKRKITGRFESAKKAPKTVSVSNLYPMLMKHCKTLLKHLMSQQYAWVFNAPVDVVKLNIPDYYTVIKHPMDLGTIKTKIASGNYPSPWAFVSDVRLTFNNAMTYNPPGNDVHIMADAMSKFFETRWKSIEKKLARTNASVKREAKNLTQTPRAKYRNILPLGENVDVPNIAMTPEERQSLSRRLESLPGDIPGHIIDFLRRHSDNANQMSEDELEIDIDALSDATLVELQKLLDDYLQEKQTGQLAKAEPCEMEILNHSGLSNSSTLPCEENEPLDEDVDIGGSDHPISSYSAVEIKKDTTLKSSKCSRLSCSSSGSSSSSDSGSYSGSESDVQVGSPPKIMEGSAGSEIIMKLEKSDIMNPLDTKWSVGDLDQTEQNSRSSLSVDVNGHTDGENASSNRQVSPEKLYRAALLRSRFADTILKAREKTLHQSEKGDPEKLRREREELERQQREEKARLQAEAKAAEEARMRAEAIAAAEAKRRREQEREAARQALLMVERTVEVNENSLILKDLEMLRSAPVDYLSNSFTEISPDHSPDAIMGGFNLGGSNPLEQLGLYMKVDDEEEEEVEQSNILVHDVEEGEID